MAGGTWTVQNKVLPGVYTNIIGEGPLPSVLGDRGIVALPVVLPWLAEHEVMVLYPADIAQFEADYGKYAVPVREAMKNASQIYIYRLNDGIKATVTISNLVCTAMYSGIFGNRLAVSVENVLGESEMFHVVTWLDAREVERQTVADISGLADNHWIKFAASGEDKSLTISAGSLLSGGADGDVTNADYAAALSALEPFAFDAIACTSDEADIKNLFVAFIKRMIRDEGRFMQGVIPDIATADFEAIISVKIGVYLEGGEHIPNTIAAAYIAGATVGVSLSTSLTASSYIGAVDVDRRFSNAELIELANSGQMVFVPSKTQSNSVSILKDINTLVSFDETHTYAMSKNKIIRITYYVAQNMDAIMTNWFMGRIPNDEQGHSRLKATILTELFRPLEVQRALRDVQPEDITITQGTNIDAVVSDYAIKVVDVMEIFYNTIRVHG